MKWWLYKSSDSPLFQIVLMQLLVISDERMVNIVA